MRAKKKYQSGGKINKTVRDIHEEIRAMRSTKRQNPDGSESTHLMSYGGNDQDGYYVMPTIFPNSDGSWLDPLSDGESDDNWNRVYQEASKRGEVISGLSKDMAEDIASGSWKGPINVPRKTVKYQSGGTVSKSAKYYQENPEARKKKAQYDTEYHSTPSRRKYRAELNQKNREAGTYGNGDGKDWDHGVRRMISQSANRAKDRPVKKAQNGMKVPEFKPFENENDRNAFISQYRSQQKDFARYRGPFGDGHMATGALRPSYPIFDLLSGRAATKAVEPTFKLMKSVVNPSWFGKNSGSIIKGGLLIDQANDLNEINNK